MMKITHRFAFFLCLGLFLFGCGDKTAGVEGIIIDGKKKPVSGVSIIFKPAHVKPGHEQFETRTGTDGRFQIAGIAPSSEYIMTILSGRWSTKTVRKIKTLQPGEHLILTDPIKIRFNQMKDGTVLDTATGLQWLVFPVQDITAAQVVNTVKDLREAGFADWRLPSRMEVSGLLENPTLANKSCCVWVAEAPSESVDWVAYEDDNNELWTSKKVLPENRIVVVRELMPPPAAH
jgi:hypothetical protein